MFQRFNFIFCSVTLLVSQQVDSRRFRAADTTQTVKFNDMTQTLEAIGSPKNPTAMQTPGKPDNAANVDGEHVIEILPDTGSDGNNETTVSRDYGFSIANLRATAAELSKDGRLANEIVRKQLSAKMFGQEPETVGTRTDTEGSVDVQPESVSDKEGSNAGDSVVCDATGIDFRQAKREGADLKRAQDERERQEAKFNEKIGKIIDHPLGCFILCILSPVLLVLVTILDACFN